MLDTLLACGRHLPVLDLVLSWTPPSSWVRLRRVRRAFLFTLSEERLKELTAGQPLHHATLFEVVDEALKQRCLGAGLSMRLERDDAEDMESEGDIECELSAPAVDTRRTLAAGELHVCELTLLASLRGLQVNEAQQLTGATPLMRAAEESHLHLCRLLLSRRADADSCTVGGATALSLALDPCCMRCMTMSHRSWCHCPRLAVAQLLLRHTSRGLATAFAATVRLALQDSAWIPALAAFVEEKGMPINTELLGPDSRWGTPISVALERRVRPVEAPPMHRRAVVASLLELRADIGKRSYAAWWGGAASNLLDFASLNRCDEETVQLLTAAVAAN